MTLLYLLMMLSVLLGIGGYYLSKELKKYTDIGTVDERS